MVTTVKTSDTERQPWDRITHESPRAYENFCAYRDAGPQRSLRKLVADGKATVKLRRLEYWSSRWNWFERAAEYDAYLDRQARFTREKDRLAMLDRHARLAMLGQSLALDTLRKRLQEAQEDPTKTLSMADVTRLLDISVRVERLSRGQPTEISELGGAADRPLRMRVEETARRAIENVLGLSAGVAERIEDAETAPAEAQPEAAPDPGVIDPFAVNGTPK